MGEPVANGGDDAPAGAVEAGIDAEDDHAALFSDRVGALRIWRAKLASSDRFIPHPQAPPLKGGVNQLSRSEEHTSELQSLMRISYAVFCLQKKKNTT